jgi:hypothetical protein
MKMMQHSDNLQSSFPVNKNGNSLEEMFERMEIKIVGRENDENKSEKSFDEDD